jgi:sugar phosphate isomerase/epimerase
MKCLRCRLAQLPLLGLVGALLPAEPAVMGTTERQETCVLINVIDHDYEKITPEQFARLSAIGYRTIELGAYLKPLSPPLLAVYRSHQFRTLASGGSLSELRGSLDAVIARARQLQQSYVICYWPWLDSGQHITEEQCRESAVLMNELGARCRKAGLGFAFHNHELEFRPLNGRTVFDCLLDYCDPGLVQIELDVYHALHAKCDVIALMRAHRGRIDILHLNTMDEQSENPIAGDGMPDFPGIIATSRAIGVRYLVIEGSGLKHPLRYLADSYDRLATLTTAQSAGAPPVQR